MPRGRVQDEQEPMSKHVIVVVNLQPEQPRYFLGYKDRGNTSECLWTPEPWMALWTEAEEAKIEALLLAELCPSYAVIAWPLSLV
jgi:hypothetical protein